MHWQGCTLSNTNGTELSKLLRRFVIILKFHIRFGSANAWQYITISIVIRSHMLFFPDRIFNKCVLRPILHSSVKMKNGHPFALNSQLCNRSVFSYRCNKWCPFSEISVVEYLRSNAKICFIKLYVNQKNTLTSNIIIRL